MKMTITVPDELYWKLQEDIAKRRKQQKDAVIEAIEKYIREGGDGGAAHLDSVRRPKNKQA